MTSPGPAGNRIAVDAARIIAVGVPYAVAAKLGLLLATIGVTVTLVWPASGVAVAALVLLGDRMVIGVALGAFLANATDRKSTRLNSSHGYISYAAFCCK